MDEKDKPQEEKEAEEKDKEGQAEKEVSNYRKFSRIKHSDHKFKVIVNDKQVIEIVKADIVWE